MLAAVLVAAVMGGCGGSEPVSDGSPVTREYRIAEEVSSQSWTLVVRSVVDPFTQTVAGYTPTPGTHPIALDVALTNRSSKTQDFGLETVRIEIEADGGRRYGARLLLAASPIVAQMHPNGIKPGATVTGVLPYEITDGATGLVAAWRPDRLVPPYRIVL